MSDQETPRKLQQIFVSDPPGLCALPSCMPRGTGAEILPVPSRPPNYTDALFTLGLLLLDPSIPYLSSTLSSAFL